MTSSRLEELRRRVQADPTSIAFAALAEEYRRAGQYDEAIEVCRTGLTRHPAYISARVTLGRTLLELDRLDEAEGELVAVLKIAPENLAAIRAQAEIHARRTARAAARAAGAPSAPQETEPHAAFELDLIAAVPDSPHPEPPSPILEASSPAAPGVGQPAPGSVSVPIPSIMERPAEDGDTALPLLERFLERILARKARSPVARD